MVQISPNSAALTACEASNWTYSNLEIQKILYLSHMKFLSEQQEPLIKEKFEAWKLGPVISSLYHQLKIFGSDKVENIFNVKRNLQLANHRTIAKTVEIFADFQPYELVDLTHRGGGAWDRYFEDGARGVVIPNKAILRDFQEKPF